MAEFDSSRARSISGSLLAACSRYRVWLTLWLVTTALASLPALAWFGWMQSAVDHRYAPDEHFRQLGTVFRFDHRAALGQLDSFTGHVGAVLALCFMLLGAFSAGGWLTTFLTQRPTGTLREFLGGGARFFGRFLRVWLLTLVLLALATWITRREPWDHLVLGGILRVPTGDFTRLETLSSERTVFLLRAIQAALHALAVGLILVWADYTRTRLALFDTRSALWAGIESALFLITHPVRALHPIASIFLLEVATLFALGLWSNSIDANLTSTNGVLLLFLLGQLALTTRIVLRGARYHAAITVSHAHIRPIARPDPWAHGRPH